MSDEQITIRHVRLCQCGKIANHDSVCWPGRTPGLPFDNVERISTTAENIIAERGRLRYERNRRKFDTDRRSQLAQMDDLALHRWITQNAVALSTVKANTISKSAPNSENQRIGPGPQQTLDDDPRWREHVSVIRRRLEQAAELILEAQGLSTVASTSSMDGTDKDKLILHHSNQGLRAQAVVDRLGTHIAGNAETVRRVRRREGYDKLGYEKEQARL